jgi:hypothetical protein
LSVENFGEIRLEVAVATTDLEACEPSQGSEDREDDSGDYDEYPLWTDVSG